MTGTSRGADAATVSIIVPLRDELARLPAVLAMIEAQTRAADEVVVADGRSSDGSRAWLEQAAASRPWLRVVDNPERIVPTGLNAALAAATGELIVRMDTHADYPPDYVASVVSFLGDHPDVAGVGTPMRTEGRGPWGQAIAAVLRRPLGLGGAAHRVGGSAGPIPHVFSGAYRRAALAGIGGWDARLPANEDFEADIRIAKQGGSVWLSDGPATTWHTRTSLAALAKQMWRYGGGKATTLRMHPDSLRVRQLAPPSLIVGLVGLTAARPRLGVAAASGYLAGTGALGAAAARSDGASPWRGALVPAAIHLPWGAALLAGLVRHGLGAGPVPLAGEPDPTRLGQ